MSKKTLFRSTMLVAGLLAVLVILLSSSFKTTTIVQEKAKKEHAGEESAATYVSAPTEAIPGTSVKMEDATHAVGKLLLLEEREKPTFTRTIARELVSFFKVLFRAIISPNAP